MQSKETIKQIIVNGSPEDRQMLFSFSVEEETERIHAKFQYFTRCLYPRYFTGKSAPFHNKMVLNLIEAYKGNINFLNIAFRGSAKTTLHKLFIVFVLLNDKGLRRKYIKILTRDLKNAKQVVTDVYNLIVGAEHVYGNPFERDSKVKREETMSSFTLADGRKFSAGTVGQTQRGHIQDAYRPDFVWFDDVEDSESVQSDVITAGIIRKIDEAIQGLSVDGNYIVSANYISDIGVIQNFRGKNVTELITPIAVGDKPTWSYFTKEKLEAIKKDAEDWWGEYMCDPITGSRREFKKELFQYVTMDEVKRMDTRCYLTIDPAVSKKDSADFTGFTLNWVNKENKWHFKAWKEKINSSELVDRIFALYTSFKPEKVGIEETAFTLALKPFLDEIQRTRNLHIPFVDLKHGGDKKEIRIRGLLPRYESNSIFHIKGECDDLEGELLRFPLAKHDDTMDSAAYQIHIAEKPYEYVKDDEDYADVMYADIGL